VRERGVEPGLVIDEGGAVVDGVLPGVSVPTAMVGVAERGVMTLHLTAREAADTRRRRPRCLRRRGSRGRSTVHRHPFPTRIAPPVRAMFATVAPHAPQPLRWVFGNLGVTGPSSPRRCRLGPETNAMVRTTAVATELSGAPGRTCSRRRRAPR
jgi:carboxypeptidase PM20D1